MIEHILFTLFIFGIDNIIIEVSKDLPIFDGSAVVYRNFIGDLGVTNLRRKRRFFKFNDALIRKRGNRIISWRKPRVEISVLYDPGHKLLRPVRIGLNDPYDLLRARTFDFIEESDPRLKNYRFGLGITEEAFFPELRYPDEPARHKLLDLIGDLYTVGRPFLGKIMAINPNHALNIAFVKSQWRATGGG
jgi:UDP-3-O-acyl-N-acetylglucosamine deacetylase